MPYHFLFQLLVSLTKEHGLSRGLLSKSERWSFNDDVVCWLCVKDQEKLPVMNRPLSLACDNLNDTFLLDERALRPFKILFC